MSFEQTSQYDIKKAIPPAVTFYPDEVLHNKKKCHLNTTVKVAIEHANSENPKCIWGARVLIFLITGCMFKFLITTKIHKNPCNTQISMNYFSFCINICIDFIYLVHKTYRF